MNDTEIKIKRTKAYLVQVSRGNPIPIDEEELPKVIAALESGRVAILKQGIINPSYVTSVVADRERVSAWLEDTKYDEGKRELGIKPLVELINRSEVLKQLEGAKVKTLGGGK